jgi:formylglycine-generating enzyme required for sulfatase activity
MPGMPHRRTAITVVLALAATGALRARADLGLEGIPRYDHVAIIVLENEDASDTFGPGSPAQYLNGLRAEGTYLPQYFATSHVSLGNYITMMSGLPANPSTTSDCLGLSLYNCVQTVVAESPPSGPVHLGDQLDLAGFSWAGYADMDARIPQVDCFHAPYSATDPSPDLYQGDSQNPPGYDYADRHNPFIYFANVVGDGARCAAHVHPYSRLAADLAADALPAFSFVSPDTCHDGHDDPCSNGSPGGLVSADLWLAQEVPALLAYLSAHNGLLIITFDEGNPASSGQEVCTTCAGAGAGGRTGAILLGAGVPRGAVIDTAYDHFSLLRTLEDSFGIALHLGLAANANVVAMTDVFAATDGWAAVPVPGNPADSDPNTQHCGPGSDQPCGAVADAFQIGKYEVTNAQYAAFLNAVAATDPHTLYDIDQPTGTVGITRSGNDGSYTYQLTAGRSNMPVNWVSWYSALRYANWRHNGEPGGPQDATTTEDGAYTFTGAWSVGPRNPGARFFLPTEDEWYKAAYFDPGSSAWFDYPAASDQPTTCSAPTSAPNSANCGSAQGDLTGRGAYDGSRSPSGTFDQGGNVAEWTETAISGAGPLRSVRGGSFDLAANTLAAANRTAADPQGMSENVGFRLPEPGRNLALVAGALALMCLRARRLRQGYSHSCSSSPGEGPMPPSWDRRAPKAAS